MRVADVMTRDVLTLGASETLEDAARKLATRGISGAPVTDWDGNIVGILSESDILDHLRDVTADELAGEYLAKPSHGLRLFSLLAEMGRDRVAEVMDHLRSRLVKEAMTRDVVSVAPDDALESVAAIMVQRDINRVPVLEDGRLVGIVTRHDVIGVIGRT